VSDNGGSVGAAPTHLWAKLIPEGEFATGYGDYHNSYGNGDGWGYGNGSGYGEGYGYGYGAGTNDGNGYGGGETSNFGDGWGDSQSGDEDGNGGSNDW